MEPSNWASAHSDALRDLFAKGMSFSEIGREINSRFGTSYTRSAVIGRAKRMGLSGGRRLDDPPLAPYLPAAPHPFRPHSPSSPGRSKPPKSAFKQVEAVKLRCVGVQPRLITLIELQPGDCRYPYGGDKEGETITFCGHPRHPGSSYCPPHFRLTGWPGTRSGRAVSPVVLRLVAA